MQKIKTLAILIVLALMVALNASAQNAQREKLLMDANWKFAYGHSSDVAKDFGLNTSYFTVFAKAGYGDGPASPNFDDRAWRQLDLPHDWAVEQLFSGNASHSHGYLGVGWKYPENSVGWYRKTLFIPESDLGRKISITFDGVYRNSVVWVNGFYLGQEQSGYAGFEYDITDYLNYGGNNVITVRADASIEEGWFYEGAGIYRHVWMNKTSALHVATDGIFASSELDGDNAVVTARATIVNTEKNSVNFQIEHKIIDASGNIVAEEEQDVKNLRSNLSQEYFSKLLVDKPNLWSPDSPYLYKLVTTVTKDGKEVDKVETTIGIRTIRFDAQEGFFLNGKHVKIVGSNNHQDHAGVGAAIPDALQEFRIQRLKDMGGNAYRCAHNPPTPELLDACDKLGMLVLNENRLQGINQEHFDLLERLMKRDRNHPSVIAWSLGNEEWAIESNIKGARITETMQRFAQTLDSTRRYTVAVSGGCGFGSSQTVDVMGFNYLAQCNIDEYKEKNFNQAAWGTEETTGCGARGVYSDDKANGFMEQFDRNGGVSIERGWKFYAERPWLAGLFYWTGFDYRGEPNPLSWPAVGSQFGILDQCGFPKDAFYYLKANWGNEPVLHLLPHWNWKGKEGEVINVWAYSNCDQVELFLNKKSLGRKPLPQYGHIEWPVKYAPGTLLAIGYKNGKQIIKSQVSTTGDPSSIELIANNNAPKANSEDVVVVTVKVNDAKGLNVPTANSEIFFDIEGEGKIIGVGNGNSASHEPDKFIDKINTAKIKNFKELVLTGLNDWPAASAKASEADWKTAFQSNRSEDWTVYKDTLIALRASFDLNNLNSKTTVNLFSKSIVENQTIYVNGHLVASNLDRNNRNQSFKLDQSILKEGTNEYVVVGQRFRKRSQWDEPNTDPGLIQVITQAEPWKRTVFNGLAQVIIQTTGNPGDIKLTAKSEGLQPAVLVIPTVMAAKRASVE